MKGKAIFVLMFGLIFMVFSFTALSKSFNLSSQEKLRADEGELVWIILNHVKPDKRQQFEEFMNIMDQVFYDLIKTDKISAEESKVWKQMRFLHPTEANEDGSYTYVFLADPWKEGVESRISYWLRKKYSEEEAQKYGKMFSDSLMHPQVSYMSKQGKYK
jgi:hypothetical protein